MAKIVPILIAVVAIILFIGGVSTYIVKSGSTVTCEACGMETAKEDISTIRVVTKTGDTHFACCPVCAMVVALYYENDTLQTRCFSCGKNVTVEFVEGNITSVNPSGDTYNVSMIFGMACMKNKFVCSNECAQLVRTTHDWATGLPTKTMNQTLGIAETKFEEFTVGYKPIEIPAITYALVFAGVILLIAAPLEWSLVEKKKTVKEE